MIGRRPAGPPLGPGVGLVTAHLSQSSNTRKHVLWTVTLETREVKASAERVETDLGHPSHHWDLLAGRLYQIDRRVSVHQINSTPFVVLVAVVALTWALQISRKIQE